MNVGRPEVRHAGESQAVLDVLAVLEREGVDSAHIADVDQALGASATAHLLQSASSGLIGDSNEHEAGGCLDSTIGTRRGAAVFGAIHCKQTIGHTVERSRVA